MTINEDFIKAMFGGDNDRDLIIAGNYWNAMDNTIKDEFIDEFDTIPDMKKFLIAQINK